MSNDAFLQLRTALNTTTETTGGDTRTGVGAVFINKEIDKMIRDTGNRTTDLRQLVQRKTIMQEAKIFSLKTSLGSTSKTTVYSEGGTGVPYPNQYLQCVVPTISYRSDYEVTGKVIASSSSYFDALATEAKDAVLSHLLTEEQMFIFGDDTTAETGRLTLNGTVGVSGSFKGLYQLLRSAVTPVSGITGGFADTTSVYGHVKSATITDRQYALNCKTVCTSDSASNPLSIPNMNAAISASEIAAGKGGNRIFLCSVLRMDAISDLIAPQGRYVQGASSVELDGGQRVLAWRGYKIISSRFMTNYSVVSTNGTSCIFTPSTDNCVLFLNLDNIEFDNVAGVDMKHRAYLGADASQRSDVEGGAFFTYGALVMTKFNDQVVIWNLSAP